MIDELGLEYEESGRGGRHRRRRRDPDARDSGRTLVTMTLVLVLLGVVGVGGYLGLGKVVSFFSAPDYDNGGAGEVNVKIEPDQNLSQIATTLQKADVVKSEKAFVNAAEDNARSKNIQPGVYKLRLKMRAKDAVSLLISATTRVINGVTIPEGKTAKQIYTLLSEFSHIPVKQFEAAGKDPEKLGVPAFWFNRSDKVKVKKSLEGFLFPQTYEFEPDADATTILKTMVQQFLSEASDLDFVKKVESTRGGISPYEALIVASLSQAEAGVPEDLGKVSRVAYNRVYGEGFPCGCLEMDVTVNYWFNITGRPIKASKDMTAAELDNPANPYNRKLKGLIPTPINNPGLAAMKGAMDPPAGKWLYFVAIDKQGHSAFATTFEEQLRNQERARKNGVL